MHVDILAYYAYSSKIQIFFSVGGYRFLVAWRPPLAFALLGCGNVIAHSVIAVRTPAGSDSDFHRSGDRSMVTACAIRHASREGNGVASRVVLL